MKWCVSIVAISWCACSPFAGASGSGSSSSTDASALDAALTGDGGNADGGDDGDGGSGNAGGAFECAGRSTDADCIDFNGGSTTAGYSGGVPDPSEFSADAKGQSTNVVEHGMLVATADSSVDDASISTTEPNLNKWTATMRMAVALAGDMEVARFDGAGGHVTVRATTGTLSLYYNDVEVSSLTLDLTQLQIVSVIYDGAIVHLDAANNTVNVPTGAMQLKNVAVGARYPGTSKNAVMTLDYLYVLDHV